MCQWQIFRLLPDQLFFCSNRNQKIQTKRQSYNQSEHVIDANN